MISTGNKKNPQDLMLHNAVNLPHNERVDAAVNNLQIWLRPLQQVDNITGNLSFSRVAASGKIKDSCGLWRAHSVQQSHSEELNFVSQSPRVVKGFFFGKKIFDFFVEASVISGPRSMIRCSDPLVWSENFTNQSANLQERFRGMQ